MIAHGDYARLLTQVRFIVMNNLFQTDLHIQRKYDLKGSTQGRFSGKVPSPNTILKDLDLDIRLKLEEGWHERWAPSKPCVSSGTEIGNFCAVYAALHCDVLGCSA